MGRYLIVVLFLCFLGLAGCSNISFDDRSRERVALINLKLGWFYLAKKQLPLAKSKLLLAYSFLPDDAEVNNALGCFFARIGELELADRYYQTAIKLAKEKGIFWHNYGKFLYQHKSYQQAAKYLLLAAKDNNYLYNSWAYEDLSKVFLACHQFKAAEIYHKIAVAHGASF